MHGSKRFAAISLFAVLLLLMGCASMAGLRTEPMTAGESRNFDADFDRVVDAALQSIKQEGLQIEESYKPNAKTWVILSWKGASAMSWGELVRVVVEKTADEATAVRVITKRKSALSVTAKGDYSQSIFSGISVALKSSSK